jgi:hypothetical protein
MYDTGLDDYRAQGVEYVVTSSYVADMPNLDANRATRRREFYASLERSARQVAEFRPETGGAPPFVYDRIYGPFDSLDQFKQPGPTIKIFVLQAKVATP